MILLNEAGMINKQSRTTNSIRNIVTGIGGQFATILLKFVVRTVFIHTLGKSYLGINGLFSDILAMLSLTELGFDAAINFKLYKPLADGDIQRIRVLMKFYKQAYRIIGGIILFAGLCLIPALPHLIRDYDSISALNINATFIFILYIFKSVSTYLFYAYRSAIVIADQRKYILDIADFFVTIVDNICQIIVLVVLNDFVAYTAVMIFFCVITNLVNAAIATKIYPNVFIREEENLGKEEVFALLKDCGALFVYKLNGVVAKATDNLVISAFIGLVMVGLYSNYLLFYTTIKGFLDKIYVAVKASMGNLYAVGSLDKKYKYFMVMQFLAVVLFGTAAVGVAICADEVIGVWVGEDYIIPSFFSILIGMEILLHGLAMNLEQVRNVSGVFRQMWYRPIISAVINLVVSIWLVQIIGIHGVIIGTLASSLLTNIAFDPHIIHKYSFGNYKSVWVYYIKTMKYLFELVIVGLFDYWLCRWILPDKGWLSVFIHIFICGLTVPTFLMAVSYKSYEAQFLLKLGKKYSDKILKKT